MASESVSCRNSMEEILGISSKIQLSTKLVDCSTASSRSSGRLEQQSARRRCTALAVNLTGSCRSQSASKCGDL